jgi:WD40 repeat protein
MPAEALARLGSARLRHGRTLHGITYSPDGTLLISWGSGRVRAWQAATGKLVWQVALGDGERASDGCLSADGKAVVVLDGPTCHWLDVRTGKEVRRCDSKVSEDLQLARLAPGGEMVAVVDPLPSDDLVVYDLPSGRERFRVSVKGLWMPAMAFSPDGKALVLAGPAAIARDPTSQIYLFDTAAGRQLWRGDSPNEFHGAAFSPDRKKLLLCELYKRLEVRDVAAGKVLHTIEPKVGVVSTVAFTPDSASVVAGGGDLDVVQFEVATGKESRRFPTDSETACLAFTPDGKGLAAGTRNGAVSQWALATGRPRAASADRVHVPGPVRFADGSRALQVWDGALTTVDWRSGREVGRVRLPHRHATGEVFLSPDGRRVAGRAELPFAVVWDVASGKERHMNASLMMGPAAFSPDGKTLYVGVHFLRIDAFEVETSKRVLTLDNTGRQTELLVVAPTATRLATAQGIVGERREITVWDLAARKEFRQLALASAESRAAGLAFSPDGDYLVAVGGIPAPAAEKGNGFVTVWDVRSGEARIAASGLADNLTSVAYSPDGRQLAIGGADGIVRLWEVATGKERHRFAGHDGAVVGVVFSPEGKFIAASSPDAPILVWDVEGNDGKPPSTVPFTDGEKTDLWKTLDDADASAAFAAMRQLLARPGPAVALLRERLRPAAEVGDKDVQRLVRDLDADTFAAREKAAFDLRSVADRAEVALRKALKDNPPAEAKRRIEAVLESTGPAGTERRREARSVEVLERIATAEARELLAALARGAEGARATREARAAVERLKAR